MRGLRLGDGVCVSATLTVSVEAAGGVEGWCTAPPQASVFLVAGTWSRGVEKSSGEPGTGEGVAASVAASVGAVTEGVAMASRVGEVTGPESAAVSAAIF